MTLRSRLPDCGTSRDKQARGSVIPYIGIIGMASTSNLSAGNTCGCHSERSEESELKTLRSRLPDCGTSRDKQAQGPVIPGILSVPITVSAG